MPLLDHFHPPLHGPRRWEGFHHEWAALIALYLNQDVLPLWLTLDLSVPLDLEASYSGTCRALRIPA